jgi:acyl-CoA reductase-like NAD-dependent aldehyde dehydrogenase
LVEHPDVAMVSFTGDVSTGRKILQAALGTIKKVHLELGGKAPAVIFEDADLAWVAQRLRRSSFYNTGQDCTAATRIIVHKSVADRLRELLLREIQEIRVGDPFDPQITMGPLVSKAQLEKVAGMVERAKRAGAKILVGGNRPDGKGYFYLPTVIDGVQQADEIVQKEVFGPVLTVQTFEREAEALALANGVAYALTGSVWTQNLDRAMRVLNKLQFGTVWVNNHTRLTPEMPHGGGKCSGYSKDMSTYALEEYTQIKHVMIRHSP